MRMRVQLRSPKSTFKVETDTALNISGGYDDGFNEGFSQGKTEGFTEGEAIGYEKGESAGYQSGFAEGDSAGYSRGYGEGETEGYNNGYNKGVEDTTPSGEIELTENGKTYDVAKYASAKVNISGIEDLTTVLNEQDALIAELKSLLAQKAKLGDAKLPSLIDGTVTELTAEDLAGCTKIGKYAFSYRERLTKVGIPDTVTEIDERAFERSAIEDVVIPENVANIRTYAFSYCQSLRSVVFKTKEMNRIGSYAFSNCQALESIELPKMSVLENNAFYYSGIKSIDFTKVQTTLGSAVCSYCKSLTKATLGSYGGITNEMFYSCEALENITIPTKVNTIGTNAFRYCYKLSYVDLMGIYRVFPKLSSSTVFQDCGRDTEKGTFEIRVSKGRKAALSVMTNWSAYADNIVEVGDEEIPEWISTEGLSYTLSGNGNSYICDGIGTASTKDIVIAEFVNGIPVAEIGDYDFNSANLTSIVIPRTVTKLGSYACSRNPRATSVKILGPLHTVGDSAFFQLTDMTSVELAEGIELISRSMFSWCENLPSIAIPSTVTKIGEYAFQYCKKLEFVDLTAYGNDVPFPIIDGTQPFTNCGTSTASGTFEIRVPAGRKAELAAMTNWSTYADNIVEVS